MGAIELRVALSERTLQTLLSVAPAVLLLPVSLLLPTVAILEEPVYCGSLC